MKIDDIKFKVISIDTQQIDDSVYFGEKYKDFISNSRLSLINPEQDGTPEKFFKGFIPIYSDALRIGNAVHELCLQSDKFEMAVIERPSGKLGFVLDELYSKIKLRIPKTSDIIDATTKVGYYVNCLTDIGIGKIGESYHDYVNGRCITYKKQPVFLNKTEAIKVQNCINAYKKDLEQYTKGKTNPSVSYNEKAIIIAIETTMPDGAQFILPFKGKLDNYIINNDHTVIINDIKTIGRSKDDFWKNIDKYHYRREMAVYGWLLSEYVKHYYGIKNFDVSANFLVISTMDFRTEIVPMTVSDFKQGQKEFLNLLRLIAYYYYKGYRFE